MSDKKLWSPAYCHLRKNDTPTPPDYSHSSPLSDKLWTVTTKYRFSVCQNRIEPVVCIVVQQVGTILTIYYVQSE